MNRRPLSITIISWTLIVGQSLTLLISILSFVGQTPAQRLADLEKHWMVHVAHLAAVVCGVFMLYGYNWARWLLVAWTAFHVVVGALHSPLQLATHILLFFVVLYFLFRRPASVYFRTRKAEGP